VRIYPGQLLAAFTTGQLVFAGLFAAAFIIAMLWAYARDKKITGVHYRNVYKVLLGIIIIFFILFAIVKLKSKIL
jgi:hypothetical protein